MFIYIYMILYGSWYLSFSIDESFIHVYTLFNYDFLWLMASAMSNQRVAHRASQAFTAKHAVSELPASMQADLASARPVASSLCFPQQLSQNSWCPKPWTDGWLISNLIQKISDYMNMCLCFFSGWFLWWRWFVDALFIAESLLITFLSPDFWMKPLRCWKSLEPSIVVSLNPNVLGGWAPKIWSVWDQHPIFYPFLG